ncbi:MarR family transcriptional regulator [Anaerorhabdus sp.]|uniref:MarR family transcriptional regulator n=1 Tax=Anaerorhabdus sp. TaxID=1872524 RepID=UPI002FC804B9
MDIKNTIKNYFHEMTLNELHLMNDGTDWDISYNSLLYLDLINMTPNCTGSYLAEKLNISKAAVTLKLNELIKDGLVVKKQSEEDRRVFYVEVSSESEDYYKQYGKALNRAILKVKEKYDEKEIQIFCAILDEIRSEYIREMENEK